MMNKLMELKSQSQLIRGPGEFIRDGNVQAQSQRDLVTNESWKAINWEIIREKRGCMVG